MDARWRVRFFFSRRRRHTRFDCDWSSDVCSSDLGVGNGALTGAIWHTSMVRPLQAGYAVANSDLGHLATNSNWALGHPEKVIDYANRGDHVTAEASKSIVSAFYGSGPQHSYFHGCSNGGHQALMEAER